MISIVVDDDDDCWMIYGSGYWDCKSYYTFTVDRFRFFIYYFD